MLVLGDGAFYPADFVWFGGAWGAALGAWAGAMPIPLDWARGSTRVIHSATAVVRSFNVLFTGVERPPEYEWWKAMSSLGAYTGGYAVSGCPSVARAESGRLLKRRTK